MYPSSKSPSPSSSVKIQRGIFVITSIALISLIARIECKPTEVTKAEKEAGIKNGSINSTKPSNDTQTEAKDLKYTFENEDEIPEGFKVHEQRALKFTEFSVCRDDSGGICIPVGQCTQNLKPIMTNEGACDAGFECCLGGPPEGTPCKNRGGECVEVDTCGKNPAQFTSDTECNHANGETCCIWLY